MLFHVIKMLTKLLEAYLIFTSFQPSSPPYSSPVMKAGRRTFDSSHHIYLRRRRWAMELIAAVGTKLQWTPGTNELKLLIVARTFQIFAYNRGFIFPEEYVPLSIFSIYLLVQFWALADDRPLKLCTNSLIRLHLKFVN